jgi:enoyl-CoA hydratase
MNSSNSDEVLLVTASADGVLLLRINRLEAHNALSSRVFAALRQALRSAADDPAIRVVILTGRGKHFAAGSDIRELAAHTPVSIQLDERENIWREIAAFPKPIIGAVAGYCFGGGCELAMHCDILIASDSARFAQPEINLGLMPGAGGTQRLPRAVGKSLAMQMALTGEPIDAQRALLAGLVSEVVDEENLLRRAEQIAITVASKGPLAVRYVKQALLSAFDQGLRDGLLLERRYFTLLFSTADKQEGFAAFHEKRKAQFTGS